MPSIFHYTDGAGLLGIFTSGEIWASEALYLNDASELAYGVSLGEAVVDELMTEHNASDDARGLVLISERKEPLGNVHTFVACFCAEGDLLSQWRGYAGGIGGYAIGFDKVAIQEAVKVIPAPLWPVEYEDAVQRAHLREDLEPHVLRFLEADSMNDPVRAAVALRDMWLRMYVTATHIKSPAFAAEQESRILVIKIDPYAREVARFRAMGPLIVPYISIPLASEGRLPITEVRFGPTPHPDLTRRSLRMFLTSLDYDPDLVQQSAVPLRA